MKKLLVIPLLALVCCFGCNSFERDTFNTLSSSKAVIDQAQADYEGTGSVKISHDQCAFSIINNAKAAQTAAVNTMVVYEQLKASSGNLNQQEAVVITSLASLAPLVVQVQSLVSNPTAACAGAK